MLLNITKLFKRCDDVIYNSLLPDDFINLCKENEILTYILYSNGNTNNIPIDKPANTFSKIYNNARYFIYVNGEEEAFYFKLKYNDIEISKE